MVTVVVSNILGLGNGLRDEKRVVASLVGVGMGANDGFRLGLGAVDGVAEGLGVGTEVVGGFFELKGGITVWLGDELDNNIGFGLGVGVGVLDHFIGLGLGTLFVVVNGTVVVVSLEGHGV